MSAPLTIRELCARATKGPWRANYCTVRVDKKYGEKVCSIASPSGAAPEAWSGIHMQRGATAQLIARLSPDVVLKVVEALEAAKERIGQKRQSNYYAGAAEADVIDYEVQTKLFDALALLNAPNRDPK